MTRNHLWLALALVAQLLLLAVMRAPSAAERDGAARAFIPQLEQLEASRIELVGEDGARLELRRTDSGWTVPDADGFPADSDKIDTLLDDLRALTVRRPLVRSSRHHATFRVADDDFVGRLRIWADADRPAVDLLLGSASNYRATHARLAAEDAVYELEGLAPFDLRPLRASWIRQELLTIADADVTRLRLTNATGVLSLTREEGGWVFDDGPPAQGFELDAASVERLLAAATKLRLVDSAGLTDPPLHGLESPAATIVLEQRDGRSARLDVGAPVADDDGKRYVRMDGLEFTVTARESALRELLDTTRETLLRPSAVDGAVN